MDEQSKAEREGAVQQGSDQIGAGHDDETPAPVPAPDGARSPIESHGQRLAPPPPPPPSAAAALQVKELMPPLEGQQTPTPREGAQLVPYDSNNVS